MKYGLFNCSDGISKTLLSRNDLTVRTSISKDWKFLDKLMKDESKKIGFLQRRTWDKYVWGGERNFITLICEKNNQMVGYVFFTPGIGINRPVKIQQIVIQEDCRRIEYGTALCDCIADFCFTYERSGISLRCRADLEANNFWKALGFKLIKIFSKGSINHVGMKASNDIFQYLKKVGDDLFSVDTEYVEKCTMTKIFENANLEILDY